MQATIEYSEMNAENRSVRTTHLSAKGFRSTWNLIHKTAGYETAGSCARLTNEAWGAIAISETGTTYGSWYKTEADAREHFNRVTNPVVELAVKAAR